MRKETRSKIKRFMIEFAKELTTVPFTVDELKKAFPFHSLFFPEEALISFKQQRSIVTKMGMTLYPKIAELVAKDRYEDVNLDHEIIGEVEVAKINVIDRIINDLRAGRIRPNFNEETKSILSAKSVEKRKVRIIADLFVGDFKPGPLFMEIKSPRPNLDVCAESKKKMLFFRAIFADKQPQAFLAFPYNPFVHRKNYKHSFTERIMDLDHEVLIGEEMWNKLGGKGTYDELLAIIEEAKEEIRRSRSKTLDEF